MAIRLDASTDALSRTTNLPTITSFTMMGWFRLVVDTNAQVAFLALGASATNVRYTWALDTDGVTVLIWNGSTFTTSTALVVNTWYHLAMTVAGTGAGQFLAYKDGVQIVSLAGNASVAAQKMWIGNDEGPEPLNGRAAAIKVWSGTVLTADQIKNEMRCYVPVHMTNLNTWSPLLASTDVGNYGTTGAWAVGGTLTTEDGPPIAWSLRPAYRIRAQAAVAAAVRPWPPVVLNQAVMRGVYV